MRKYIQILTTTPDQDTAEKLANTLVDEALAACVQIVGPVKSIYRWKGKKESADEYLCQIKTQFELYEKVEDRIVKLHPYEVPEIIAFVIEKGYDKYLDWLADSISS